MKIDDNTGINPGGKLYNQSIKKSHYAKLKFKSLISLDSLECTKRRLKMLYMFAMIESTKSNTFPKL